MRPNSKNWPVWVLVVATAWFVAITFSWALRPLTDHVAVTVEHVFLPGQPVTPGARDAGPTINVTCGTPAGGATFDAKGLPDLGALRDSAGKPLVDPRFARTPCSSYHQQSHILWFANVVLYVAVVGVVVWVVRRRLRTRHELPEPAATRVGV